MASNLTRWSEFLQHTKLKDAWDILRVDLRGHGRSMYRCRLSMEIWCEDLLRLLDTEGYSDAVLVGHSLGAQIALHFAHRHPSRVRGLVLIDPILGRPSTRMVRWGRRLRPVLRMATAVIRLLNRMGLRRRHIPERDMRALDERTRDRLLAAGKIEEMVSAYKSPWPDLKHFPTANFLEEAIEMARPLPSVLSIVAPVLVVLSKGATYADPAITRQMTGRFRQATVVAVDAYHWPLTEKPTETREAIEKWCAELDSAGGGHPTRPCNTL
jgi:pimeloyl-ACP methyl ester carboxylesterase